MSGTSYFSTSSSTGVVNKAERDKGPQRRYLISAALALIALIQSFPGGILVR
jgi:hypothetical protein